MAPHLEINLMLLDRHEWVYRLRVGGRPVATADDGEVFADPKTAMNAAFAAVRAEGLRRRANDQDDVDDQ